MINVDTFEQSPESIRIAIACYEEHIGFLCDKLEHENIASWQRENIQGGIILSRQTLRSLELLLITLEMAEQ